MQTCRGRAALILIATGVAGLAAAPKAPVILSTDIGSEIDYQWAVVYMLANHDRYYSLYDRIYNRSIRELRILQTKRTLRYLVPPEVIARIPALVSTNDLTKRTQAARQSLVHAIEDVLTQPAPPCSTVQNEPTRGPVLVEEVG